MLNKQILKEVYHSLSEAIDRIAIGYKGNSLTDIFLVLDDDSGEISVYDDEQTLFYQFIVPQWREDTDEDNILRYLREVVEKLDLENKFDNLNVYKPFSINFADEDFFVKEEILTIEDDSVIRLDNDFLKRIDKEFDDFLDKLLKE